MASLTEENTLLQQDKYELNELRGLLELDEEYGDYNKKGITTVANNAFGIDLGTNNIKIYNRNDDNIMIEKNMIAIENKNTLFAYGNSAFEMYEKAPRDRKSVV